MWNDSNKDILDILEKVNKKETLPFAALYVAKWKRTFICTDGKKIIKEAFGPGVVLVKSVHMKE